MAWFKGGKISARQFNDTHKLRKLGFTGSPAVKALIEDEKKALLNEEDARKIHRQVRDMEYLSSKYSKEVYPEDLLKVRQLDSYVGEVCESTVESMSSFKIEKEDGCYLLLDGTPWFVDYLCGDRMNSKLASFMWVSINGENFVVHPAMVGQRIYYILISKL